jgi:hypothetical protein
MAKLEQHYSYFLLLAACLAVFIKTQAATADDSSPSGNKQASNRLQVCTAYGSTKTLDEFIGWLKGRQRSD